MRAWALALLLLPGLALAVPEGVEPLVLLPIVDGREKPMAPFWKTADGWATDAEHWEALGVVLRDGEAGRALTTEELGVSIVVQEEDASALVSIPADRLPQQAVSRSHATAPLAPSAPGVVVNYAASAIVSGDRQAVSLGHEVRVSALGGVVVSTGQANWDSEAGVAYRRGQTYWQRDNLEKLRVYQAGDVYAGDTAPVALGGVRIAKDPGALDPTRPTYPVPMLGGVALDPGTLRVLANQSEVLNQDVDAGPLTVDRYSLAPGVNETTLVVRDRFGRETVIDQATLYVAPQLLRPALTTWEVAAGAIRQGENEYRGLGVSVQGARGMSDRWTLKGSAQAGEDGHNATVGTVVAVGNAGVIEAEVGRSSGPQGDGSRLALAYDYRSPNFAVRIDHERNDNWWRLQPDVAVPVEESTRVRAFFRPNKALQWHVGASDIQTSRSKFRSVETGVRYGRGPHSVGASVAHAFGDNGGTRVDVGYRYTFGNTGRTASVRANQSPNGGALAVGGTARGEIGDVPVYVAGELERGPFGHRAQALVDWRTSVGDGRAELRQSNGDWVASAQFRGAVHFNRGGLTFTPTVPVAFAVVEIPGVEGVAIRVNGGVVGKTDKHGILVVPSLSALVPQTISLNDRDLPAHVQLGETSKTVSGRRLAGMHIVFPIVSETPRSFTVSAKGVLLPVSTAMRSGEEETHVGYDGLLFLEKAIPGQVWTSEALGCSVRVPDELPPFGEPAALDCVAQ